MTVSIQSWTATLLPTYTIKIRIVCQTNITLFDSLRLSLERREEQKWLTVGSYQQPSD